MVRGDSKYEHSLRSFVASRSVHWLEGCLAKSATAILPRVDIEGDRIDRVSTSVKEKCYVLFVPELGSRRLGNAVK
jgi:hypothetical protein